MTKEMYLEKVAELFSNGKIDEDVFWAMRENADIFCEDDEDEYEDDRLPSCYAEIEYDDMDSAEAHDGAIFDDRMYQFYMER